MSSSIPELLSYISALSQQDKFRLVQLVLEQLSQESTVNDFKSPEPFEPNDFRGVVEVSREEIDEYLRECREGWM